MPLETALDQWQQGTRLLAVSAPEQRRTLELITCRIEEELRRRLGSIFTANELAELYDRGTGWCTDLAYAIAPDAPFAWDAQVVADAAFGRYLREAADYAGGRVRFGT